MSATIDIASFCSPIGEILLGSYEGKLCLCDWKYRRIRTAIDERIQRAFQAEFREQQSPVVLETQNQLKEYFEGERKVFDIPLLFAGTDFQKSVWNTLCGIPYGKTESYLSLSRRLGNEKAIRAVASANGANAIAIVVPCHRIIGSNGELIGYAGGLQAKKKLLNIERDTQISIF